MDKAQRIAIAKDVLKLVEEGQPEFGEETFQTHEEVIDQSGCRSRGRLTDGLVERDMDDVG